MLSVQHYFFCIPFGGLQICIGSDMNTWYFQFSPKHVNIKATFLDEKYIFLLTSYAYDFFNSLQVNEICISPLLILLPLKIKYPRKISALSFSRIAISMLSYNFICIVWPKEKAECLGMWKKVFFLFPIFTYFVKPKPQDAYGFIFDVWSLQIHHTILIFLSSLQIHLSTPSFFHYCLIPCFPYTMSSLQKLTQSLQELNLEKESWNIVARVVRLWFVEDYTKRKTPFSTEIVLHDTEVPS